MALIKRLSSESLGKALKRDIDCGENEVFTLDGSEKRKAVTKSNALRPIYEAIIAYFKANTIGNDFEHDLDLMPKVDTDVRIRYQLWEDGDLEAYLKNEELILTRTREMFEKINGVIEKLNKNDCPVVYLTVNPELKDDKYVYCESEEIIDIVMAIYGSKLKGLLFYLITQDKDEENEKVDILDIDRSYNKIPVAEDNPIFGVIDGVARKKALVHIYAVNPQTHYRKYYDMKLDVNDEDEAALLNECYELYFRSETQNKEGNDQTCFEFKIGKKILPLNKESGSSDSKHLFDVSISDKKIYLEQLGLFDA